MFLKIPTESLISVSETDRVLFTSSEFPITETPLGVSETCLVKTGFQSLKFYPRGN